MNNEKKTINIKEICEFFKISFQVSPKYSFWKLILSFLSSVLPIISALLWKTILDDIVFPSNSKIFFFIALSIIYCFSIFLNHIINYWHSYIDKIYSSELLIFAEKREIQSCSQFDLSYYDDHEKQNLNKELSKAYKSSADISWGLINFLSAFISFIVSLIIVCNYSVFLGVITIILTVPKFFYSVFYDHKNRNFNIKIAEEKKLMNFYGQAMQNGNVLLDVKLNESYDYFINQYLNLNKIINKKTTRHKIHYELLSLMFDLISSISYIIVVIMTLLDATQGLLSLGTIQYHWSIVENLKNQSLSLMHNIAKIINSKNLIFLLTNFVRNNTSIEINSGDICPSDNIQIEFDHVSFSYPNTDKWVLKDCSFYIREGEKIGIVGLNGSGKTTIIKLLMRFYDPNEGEIRLNGKNIKEYDIVSLRSLFSTMFQENIKYIFIPLREGIALSDYKEKNNDKKLDGACVKSGFSTVLENKNANYDMILNDPLCIKMDNSFDLSGGEWQKLALARTYFRDTKIYIFDEPSASLDVFAEEKIFDNFTQLSYSKTAILISHRLSNMKFCSRIFVLEDGHIVEQGDHNELINLNGKYSYLYNLQIQRY